MVGLILVMQCVPRAGGAGGARGVLACCALLPFLVSACPAGRVVSSFFQTYRLECVIEPPWTIIRLNWRGDWVWFTCAEIWSPLTVCGVFPGTFYPATYWMWAIGKPVQVCGRLPERWKTFDCKIIPYIFGGITMISLFFPWYLLGGEWLLIQGSPTSAFFSHPVISGSCNTQKPWQRVFPQTNDIINED